MWLSATVRRKCGHGRAGCGARARESGLHTECGARPPERPQQQPFPGEAGAAVQDAMVVQDKGLSAGQAHAAGVVLDGAA